MTSAVAQLAPSPAEGVGAPAPSPMVAGVRKAVAKARIWSRIWWLALRTYKNPARALRAVRRVVAERAPTERWPAKKYARVRGRYFWSFYMPGWPSRAFDRFVDREFIRVDSSPGEPVALQTVLFAITKRCTLRCEHCFEWDVLNRHETLSAKDLHEVVDRLHTRGMAQLMLSGGEPLRRFEELIAITERVSADTDVWILTSGHGLTPDRAEALSAAGLTGVALSLDHWDPASHDRFRGVTGAYAWVERAAANARAAGLVVTLSLCPTREFTSGDNLDAYARTARRLGASFIQLLEPRAVGHYAGRDVALRPDQLRLLETFCGEVSVNPALRDFPSVAYIDFTRRSAGCHGAGDRYLYVDTDGAVHPCPFCRTAAGSALTGDLNDTLSNLRTLGCPVRH